MVLFRIVAHNYVCLYLQALYRFCFLVLWCLTGAYINFNVLRIASNSNI
jgi:hypothetical protein